MRSLRVYFVTHAVGLTGTLMRRSDGWLDEPPPAAFGHDEDEVLAQLEGQVVALAQKGAAELERYLWDERFEVRSVRVSVNPHSVVEKTSVIGKRAIPLSVDYASTRLASGALLVLLPRFGWRFIVEDLELAAPMIRQAVATSLAGEDSKWIYDYRSEGPELVRAWDPGSLERLLVRAVATDGEAAPEVLSEIAEELTMSAARRELPLRVGVDPVLAAHQTLFEREWLPSLLLVGPSGVGKSTFVRALAEHFLAVRRGKRGRRRAVRLWSTTAARVVAGMTYLGMWQKRCLELIDALSHEGDYLYLDRLVDVLAPQSDGASIADLLLPSLAARELAVIVECDEAELVHARRVNPSFVDKLHLLRVDEMPLTPLFSLMTRYAAARRAGLHLAPAATRRLVALLGAFRPDQSFPGKAVQFLDWLATLEPHKREVSTPRRAAEVYSQFSGLPVELISDAIPTSSDAIAARLGRRVIGQPAACRSAARALARFKAGLNDPRRPVATLFFVGPTGVGKTELCKQLAAYMFSDARRLFRVDMSELMTPGSSRRLLDVDPGVRSLATEVRSQPLTVVLFDEIEKAHPEIFDLLLGVLDEGRMTDERGRLVDFRMTLIVMTSNLGAETERRPGFVTPGAASRDAAARRSAVTRHFRPEFVARLDEVVAFEALTLADITHIVDILVGQVSRRFGLVERGIELSMSDDARVALAELGFDPAMGARPLARVIEERVVTPLAARLARDPDYGQRHVRLVCGAAGPDELQI